MMKLWNFLTGQERRVALRLSNDVSIVP